MIKNPSYFTSRPALFAPVLDVGQYVWCEVIFIFISLIEQFFMCLLFIWISSLRNTFSSPLIFDGARYFSFHTLLLTIYLRYYHIKEGSWNTLFHSVDTFYILVNSWQVWGTIWIAGNRTHLIVLGHPHASQKPQLLCYLLSPHYGYFKYLCFVMLFDYNFKKILVF